jgi:hypothetical protein
MAAAAGASGARTWLQAHRRTWLTARRLRALTIALVVAAFGVSSIGLSGSSKPEPGALPAAHAAVSR